MTHGHFDHLAGVLPLAEKFSPKIVANFEMAAWLESKGAANTIGMNKGGTCSLGPIEVTMTHAIHSSSIMDDGKTLYGGEPAGFILHFADGRNAYFAGDTGPMMDMKLIADLYTPELAILPVGSHYTMGPREAAYACRMLRPKKVIPMHFGTFPALSGRPEHLRRELSDLPEIECVGARAGQTGDLVMPPESSDPREKTKQLAAWFLGPKAENASLAEELVLHVLRDYFHWRRNYFPSDEIIVTQHMRRESLDYSDALLQQLNEMLARLKRHFPFYNPRYIAHMLSDQTLPSVLGYFAGMLYNPNNVTPEAAPVTVAWEFEVASQILEMLGYLPPPPPDAHHRETKKEFGWAHVTSGGTVATIEALWVARNVRYFPLAAREAAVRAGIPLRIKTARASNWPTSARPATRTLLGIKPNEAVFLLPRFLEATRQFWESGEGAMEETEASRRAWSLLRETGLYCGSGGVAPCYRQWPPALFVSGTAHYSIGKAADMLGIGRDQVILVDVDRHCRLDVRDLETKMRKALDGWPDAAGGDCHRRHHRRRRRRSPAPGGRAAPLASSANWASASGFTSMPPGAAMCGRLFVGEGETSDGSLTAEQRDARIGRINEFTSRRLTLARGSYRRSLQLQWGSREVCYAFLAFPQAESITVDPHKMGYIPYPCGIVAYRNDRVRHFVTQEAPYIHSVSDDAVAMHHYRPPDTLGPFILEGSKPGAAVAACWLSHKMIPPSREGYGEIIRASLSAARELYERLVHWDQSCRANHEETAYQFVTLTAPPPDTNMLCFVAKERGNPSLAAMNALNQRIYERFTISQEHGEREYSYSQPFFLSRTWLHLPQYTAHGVADFLERAGIDAETYPAEGIFVIRATVMSPYIVLAAESNHKQQLLAEFVEVLAEIAAREIGAK